MAFENITNNAKEIVDDIQDLVKSNIEYYKLDIFKKASLGAIEFTKLLVLGSIFLFVLSFVSIAAAFLIGNAVDSIGVGFLIVAGFYVLVFILVLVLYRPILEKTVIRKFQKIFFSEKKEE